MDPERRRELARKGGKSAKHRHVWTPEEARKAALAGVAKRNAARAQKVKES